MKTRFLARVASVALLGACAAIGSPAQAMTVMVDGDPAAYWTQVLLTGFQGLTGAAASPTATSRGFAMVSVALHDAVNASLGRQNYGYLGPLATPGGDTRAAASVAAHNVLVHLNPGKAADFNAALAASLALVPDGVAKTNGIATGAQIAAAVIANRANDGSAAVVPYTPSGLPGGWAPTPPALASAALPQWAYLDPWFMNGVDQFRAAAPPALGSAEYAAAFNEVKEIGAVGSMTRTGDQTASAQFWATPGAAGTAPWLKAGIDASEGQGMTTLELAALFAQVSTAVADAVIAVWDAKYAYDFWRPVTAIRAADLDGNAATALDPNWTSLVVAPPHPSYISGHSGVAGAASAVLGAVFGDATPFCLASGMLDRCWASFSAAGLDAANSRLWGGIHWSFDNQAGLTTGQQVGMFTLDRNAFQAVPEPATWAMLIAGFGLVGGVMRLRARKISCAPA